MDKRASLARFVVDELRDISIAKCTSRWEEYRHIEGADLIVDAVDAVVETLLGMIDEETLEFCWDDGSGRAAASTDVDPGEAKGWYFGDDGWIETLSRFGKNPTHRWVEESRAPESEDLENPPK